MNSIELYLYRLFEKFAFGFIAGGSLLRDEAARSMCDTGQCILKRRGPMTIIHILSR